MDRILFSHQSYGFLLFTFVVISAVSTVLFQRDTAVFAIPVIVALAHPQAFRGHVALAVSRAGFGAPFQCAMFAVPTRDTQTRSVLALAVLVTPVHSAQ